MRCFFLRGGHIAAVELMPGLTDEQAVEKCRLLYESRRSKEGYQGFEVWEEARMVHQHPALSDRPPAPEHGEISYSADAPSQEPRGS